MIRTLALITLLAGAAYGSGWTTQSLNVRFALTLTGIGTTAFIQMPLYKDNATAAGWTEYTRPLVHSGYENTAMYCRGDGDLTICIIYDDTGFICGMQHCYDTDYISNPAYDWDDQGYTGWDVTLTNGTAKYFYCHYQYFASGEFLATDADTRVANRDNTKVLQDECVWVSYFDKSLMCVPTNTTEITSGNTNFTKQACVLWMGHHYYWKMSSTLECSAETILAWFPLIYDNELIGMGRLLAASYNSTNAFCEYPSKSDVEMIVPDGPDCFYSLVDSPAVQTTHTYYIDPAYTISCIWEG